MASTSKRSSGDRYAHVWAAGANAELTAGPGNVGWPSAAQAAIACEASMYIKDRDRGVYSTTKKWGCGSLRTPEGRNSFGRDLLHRRRKAGLAEEHLGPSAVDLNLGDVGDVRGNHDFALLRISPERALDLESVERIDVALAIDDAPGRRRR